MKVEGETDELVLNVTTIALEYGFVTPYTSFFVEIPQAEEPEYDSDSGEYQSGEAVMDVAPTESYDSAMVMDDETDAEDTMVDSMPVEEATEEDAAEPASPGFGLVLALSMSGLAMVAFRNRKE